MLISCPKCGTQYDIAENLIPEQGRKFRCAKCGNVWVVTKNAPEPVSAPIPEPTPIPVQEPITQVETEQVAEEIVENADAAQSTDEAIENDGSEEGLPENQPEASSSDETPNNEEVAEEVVSENSDGALDETSLDETNIDAENAGEEKSDTASDENTDSIEQSEEGEESQEEPSAVASEYNEGAEIPEQLRSIKTSSLYEMEDFSTQSKSKGPLISFIFFLFTALIALYVGRFYIVSKFPPIQSAYEVIGVSFDVIGEGLAFKEISKEKLIVDDLNYLVVEGTLINESNQPRSVPNLVLYLYDSAGKLIQSASQKAPVPNLAPGETVDFTMNLEAPSVVATEAKISFIEPRGRRR